VAARFFLRIDDIKGESADSKHKDEIEIESFSWGATQHVGFSSGSGAGAGKAEFSDFSFTMRQSVASPVLMLSCASGKHLKEALITARGSGKAAVDYYKLRFSDLLISSFQQGASAGDGPITESISFNYSKMEMEYMPQNPKGQLGSPIRVGWDLAAGKGG
jgi:type VI secretion system secreted protein Hcp